MLSYVCIALGIQGLRPRAMQYQYSVQTALQHFLTKQYTRTIRSLLVSCDDSYESNNNFSSSNLFINTVCDRYHDRNNVVVVVVLLYGLVSTRLQHSKNIHSCVASQ